MSMATAQQQRPANGQTKQNEPNYSELLEKALDQTTFPARVQGVKAALCRRAEDLERALPPPLKGQADRLIQRAVMTLAGTETLQKVTDVSFMKCVLKAAEMGLAIDGKLAYAVPYKAECTLIVSYLGILAVARRTKTIRDCYARLVFDSDHFECGHKDGKDFLEHRPDLRRQFQEIKDAVGVYAIVILPDGSWRYEWMNRSEVQRIQACSKDTREGAIWKIWPGEMWKKTVLRRLLKNYAEDPGMQAVFAADPDPETTEEPRRASILARFTEAETIKPMPMEIDPEPKPTPPPPEKAQEPEPKPESLLTEEDVQDLWNDLHQSTAPLELDAAIEAVQRNRTKMRRSDLSRLEAKIAEMKKTIK